MIQTSSVLGEWLKREGAGSALFANWNFQWYENYRIKDSRQLYGLLWTDAPIEIGFLPRVEQCVAGMRGL